MQDFLESVSNALHLRDLFSIWALLDIVIVAVLIYQLLLLIRGTRAVHILIGVFILAFGYFITRPGWLPMPTVHRILGYMAVAVPFAVVVLFQNQIRQALAQFGKNPLAAFIPRRTQGDLVDEVTLAAVSLASKRVGALIVIEREMGLRAFYETGIALDAIVSYDLLMNLFVKDSPLHDGAAIIAGGRIKAASCFLPLTMNPSLSRSYGTRHRAAAGISEESDALAIVVSEERSMVSIADNGVIEEDLDAQTLGQRLRVALEPPDEKAEASHPIQRLRLTRPSLTRSSDA